MSLVGSFGDASRVIAGFVDNKFIGRFVDSDGFRGTFGNSTDFTGSFGEGSIIVQCDYPVYTGETSVTPKANEQTILETNEKVLMSDITVFEVPYFQVSNPQGGNTAYIAINTEVN